MARSPTTGADLLPLLSSVRSLSLGVEPGGAHPVGPPLGMRGHYIDAKPGGPRRMPAVGSNQNKAITKRLASAGHYQQVGSSRSCYLP